jgi:hypothetical protein
LGHFLEDCRGGGGPNERIWVGIMVIELLLDGNFQLSHALGWPRATTPPRQTCLFLFDFDSGHFESAILF